MVIKIARLSSLAVQNVMLTASFRNTNHMAKLLSSTQFSYACHQPHFDLDDIQWDNNAQGYGVKMPTEKRNALLYGLLKEN